MGIYFNNKLLKPDPNGSELEQKYAEGQKFIKQLYEENGGVVTLRRDVEVEWDTTHTQKKPVPPWAFPVEAYFYLETMGSVSIRYSRLAPIRKDKEFIYSNNMITMTERMHLGKDRMDLAWFIIMVTGFVNVTDNDGNLIGKKKNHVLEIDNPIADAKIEVAEKKLMAKLDSMVFLDDSPIYNLKAAEFICNYFGLTDIPLDNVERAMVKLHKKVVAEDKKNNPNFNIKKFLEVAKKIGKQEYDSEWNGKVPENGFSELQLNAYNYASLKNVAEHMGVEFKTNPKKEWLIEQVLKMKNVQVE